MITKLNVTSIYVLDKDEALDFYVGKLGLEKGNDVQQGSYRWLTVRVPGSGGTEISLEQPGPPLHDEATAEQLRELIAKGALNGLVLNTDDVWGCTRPSGRVVSPTSRRSPPTISTAPTWACETPPATPSEFFSRGPLLRMRRPDRIWARRDSGPRPRSGSYVALDHGPPRRPT
jgi:catechol 2,3-dioxygenase-like lactoylglutathione lyase family enzyme